MRSDSPLCDRGQRSGPHVAHKAVYSQGRSQGALGGVGSDVVEVRLAFHPTALPAPSFVSLVHPPADGTWHGVGGVVVLVAGWGALITVFWWNRLYLVETNGK